MKIKQTKNTLQKSILRVSAGTAAILMVPAIGMQVSDGWNWSPSDFVIMGALLVLTGSLIELVLHKVRNNTKRAYLVIGIILVCLYIWAELAVGIFTNIGS